MQTLTIGMCYHLHKSFIACRPVYVYIDVHLCLIVIVSNEKAVTEFEFDNVRTTNVFHRSEIR